ncbi:recombinase family protein [Neisseria mucosa]|uniref:recombinase family protein n=1 Tax=Neisseria mucosa TaxID=488 RepID=UPI0009B77BE7|nr:recombinase family protein [Neisseria mucosa]
MDPKEQLSKQQKAVLYIRMSTDHQKYSPDNQKAFLLEYANKNGLTVVGEFIDEGISGKADFGHILVYDASRWGRFIDPQESSYYQYICQQQNIILHKCAEPIPVVTEEFRSGSNRYHRCIPANFRRSL